MKKVISGMGVIVLTIALTGVVAVTAEQAATQTQVQTQTQNNEQLEVVKKASGLNAKSIEAMHKEHYGDGEIVIAGAIAKNSNKPIGQIMSMRKQGMGWGEIAQKNNLKLGNVMKSIHANINAYGKQAKDKEDVDAVNKVRNEVQQQEKLNMQEMMQHRNEQIQHEGSMGGQQGGSMGEHMNGQHDSGMDMNGMHGK